VSRGFDTGLVVGKFSPLHLGHEVLIGQAVASCRQVWVVSYSKPELPGCDRARRDRWLALRFPGVARLVLDDPTLARLCQERNRPLRTLPANDAPDEVHREFVGWLCHAVLDATVDAVFTSEDYGDGFAASLTAMQAASGRRQAPVHSVCVDRERLAVPVSGTRLREDVHGLRHFLPPPVYADFVQRVGILGGESSGKTRLAQGLARHFDTAWVPEYGRERWEQRGGALEPGDLHDIAREQLAREQEHAATANRWLFCDTTPLTTALYGRWLFGHVDPALQSLADHAYAQLVLCAPDFDFVQDGTRRGAAFRDLQHADYLAELATRGLDCLLVTGPLSARVEQVARHLLRRSTSPSAART
jgi:HTH-type transcriptional repressor of NAD biosynthesis genes